MEPVKNRTTSRRRHLLLLALLLLPVLIVGLYLAYRGARGAVSNLIRQPGNTALTSWFTDPASRAGLGATFDAPCPGYPFLVPSSGLVGGLPWNAAYGPYTVFNPHPGIDIFGDGPAGTIPVVAAYDGYLTREPNWTSSVIIRHDDPLHPGQTIWTYYTHMANIAGTESYIQPEFPPGTSEVFVQQGQIIGYQGLYNGGSGAARIGLHLHFSIVKSDQTGHYLNETIFENTLDPTPYLGLALNDPTSDRFPLQCLPPAT